MDMHEETNDVKKLNVLSTIDVMVNKIIDDSKEEETEAENQKELKINKNNDVTSNSRKNSADAKKEVTDMLLRRDVRTLAAERTLHRLREENDQLKHYLITSAHREHDLQRTIAELQETLQTMGKTVASQTVTMRTLSQEMQRRDPYHLIKERHHAKSLIREQSGETALPSQEATEETEEDNSRNKQYAHSLNKFLEKHNTENNCEQTNNNLRISHESLRPKHTRFKKNLLTNNEGKQNHLREMREQKHNSLEELKSKNDDTISNCVNSREQDDLKESSKCTQNDICKATNELKTILSSLTHCISQSINWHKLPYVFANGTNMRSNAVPNDLHKNVYLVQIEPTFCSGLHTMKCEEDGKRHTYFMTVVDAFGDVILTTEEHTLDESSNTIFFDTTSTRINTDDRHKTRDNHEDKKYIDSREGANNINKEKNKENINTRANKICRENEVQSLNNNVVATDKNTCELLTLINTSSVLTIQLWEVVTCANADNTKANFREKTIMNAMEERGAVCVATGQLPLSMLLATAQIAKQTHYCNHTLPRFLTYSSDCSEELRERKSLQHKEHLEQNVYINDKYKMNANVVHTIQLYNTITKAGTSQTHEKLETVCNVSFNVTVNVIAPHWFAMTCCNGLESVNHKKNNSLYTQTISKIEQHASLPRKSVKKLPSSELMSTERSPTMQSEVLPLKKEECRLPPCKNEGSRSVPVRTPENNSNTANMMEVAASSDAEIEEVTELPKTPLLTPVEVTSSEVIHQDSQERHKGENLFAASTRSLYICVKSAHDLIENAKELLDVLGRCHPRVLVWVDEQLVYTIPIPALNQDKHLYTDDKNDKSTSTNEEQGVSVEWDEDVAGFTTIVKSDSIINFEIQDVSSTGVDPMGTASVAVGEIAETPLQMTLPVMLNGKQHGSLLIEFDAELIISTKEEDAENEFI